MKQEISGSPPVLVEKVRGVMSIALNRPEALNSLNHEMVRLIREAVGKAKKDEDVRLVLFYGRGEKGFCAGGDIKALAESVRGSCPERALDFLQDEYAMDLSLHRFPKPVMVLADGVTMGGGLGISAGADIVISTERTRSAMPETRIGFFPDVGATGWMFEKCPAGYPEYLGLTGYEVRGPECVRAGFSTHMISSKDLPGIIEILERESAGLSHEKSEAVPRIAALIEPYVNRDIPRNPDMDAWVRTYFAGRISLVDMMHDLRQCGIFHDLCQGVFTRVSERSPTALAVTLELLRRNEGRPMEDVFEADVRAARFLLDHPDFLEGVRARLIDRDDRPLWRPGRVEDVPNISF